MKIVGKTTDGKSVVSGVFKKADTDGIPLDIVVQALKDVGMLPAWDHYIVDAYDAGWKNKTIRQKLTEVGVPLPDYLED